LIPVKTEPERAYTLPKVVYPGFVTDMIGVKERKMAMSNEKDSVAAGIGHGAIGIDHRSISSSMWTHATGDLAALDRPGRTHTRLPARAVLTGQASRR
jgi:hypothetical protein